MLVLSRKVGEEIKIDTHVDDNFLELLDALEVPLTESQRADIRQSLQFYRLIRVVLCRLAKKGEARIGVSAPASFAIHRSDARCLAPNPRELAGLSSGDAA